MKIKIFVITTAIVIMISTASFALELGIKGGFAMPTGATGSFLDTGLTMGGQIRAPISDNLSFGLHAGYSIADGDLISDRNEYRGRGLLLRTEEETDYTAIEIFPFADYFLLRADNSGDFFLRGGLGVHMWESEVKSRYFWATREEGEEESMGKSKEDDTDLMLALGIGFNTLQNIEVLFLYNRVFTSDMELEFFRLTLGYNFDLTK